MSLKKVYMSPESFLDHVVLGDAVVGQSLIPVRIQRLVDRLCPQLVGLQPKIESGNTLKTVHGTKHSL